MPQETPKKMACLLKDYWPIVTTITGLIVGGIIYVTDLNSKVSANEQSSLSRDQILTQKIDNLEQLTVQGQGDIKDRLVRIENKLDSLVK